MKVGTKELIEVISGLELAGKVVAKIAADKKIGADDIAHVVELAKSFDVLTDAFKGIDLAIIEAKDLDSTEILLIVTKLIEAVKNIEAARKEVK